MSTLPPKEEDDELFLHQAISVAARSRENGNHPFGAILVDNVTKEIVCEGENQVYSRKNPTLHAETCLIDKAYATVEEHIIRRCTLYSSAEPCVMCAGKMYWAGIPRLVYALSEHDLKAIAGETSNTLDLPCREVFVKGNLPVEVIGPIDIDKAREIHEGYWNDEHVNGPTPLSKLSVIASR